MENSFSCCNQISSDASSKTSQNFCPGVNGRQYEIAKTTYKAKFKLLNHRLER